jgi:methionyl-tRNA formyltransferase
MNQDNTTGISFMKIEEGLDEGPYLKQIKTPIDEQTTSEQLSKKLSELGAENILECIKVIEKGDVKFQKQDSIKATYAKKISKKETKINWQESARNILSKINSFNPSPVAWFNYNGLRHKVWKAKISELKGNAGEVIDENLTIACGEKSLRITEIQKEGKNRMLAKDFILGDKIKKGDRAE